MSRSTRISRPLLASAGALGLVALSASMASAHVTVTPSTTEAGAYTVLTFAVPHGCDGSATTKVAIQIPEQIVTVTPTVNPNWTIDKITEKLDKPIDNGEGGQYTERVSQVVYTATTPLADGYRDTFALSMQLPKEPGAKLVFPAVQTCAAGETAWTQTYDDGQDEPPHPAPFIDVTAAADPSEATTGPADREDDTVAGASGPDIVGWAGVVLGALGLAAGGTALVRGRTRS